MAFLFPWSNLHELNLDWILSKVKTLVDNNEEFNTKADYAVATADEAKTIAEQAAQATIPDGSITTQKLADGAVTGNKIGTATIQTGNLSAGCVTNAKILDGTITATKIADDTITLSKIATALKGFLSNDTSSFSVTIDGTTQTVPLFKRGNTVYCNQAVNNNSGFSGLTSATVIGTLPEGYRPSSQVRVNISIRDNLTWGLANYSNGLLAINTNGDVAIYGKDSEWASIKSIVIACQWCV